MINGRPLTWTALNSHGHLSLSPEIARETPGRQPAPEESIVYSTQAFYRNPYQSSSSSRFPCMLACLALRASAKPPARLGVAFPLSGVARPLPLPLPFMLILTALSLGAGGGNGFFGRFVGSTGGIGFPFDTGRPAPLRIGVDADGS